MAVHRFLRAVFCLFAIAGAGCAKTAVRAARDKRPEPSRSELASGATDAFWATFHDSLYDNLDPVVFQLTAAYLEQPRDPELALLLGHAHFWKLAERRRLDPDPRVTDSLILAEKYFEEAARLDPDDDRILGWLGGVRLAIGDVHQDARATTQGFFDLKESVRRWPQFNGFSMGYVMMQLPATHRRYDDGLGAYWRSVDTCAGKKVDRSNPDFAPYMGGEWTGRRAVCGNGWIAPHNFEGFFMGMGDAVLKSGDVVTARVLYENARLAPGFEQWPYRKELQERLKGLDARAARYADGEPSNDPLTMVETEYACTGCHAGDVSAFERPASH